MDGLRGPYDFDAERDIDEIETTLQRITLPRATGKNPKDRVCTSKRI
jgi:hypothetical protein